MLTVAETLKLKPLHQAHVVAGQDGLARNVSWIHVGLVSDANAAQWLNGSELVLTTSLNMPGDPDSQRKYILGLADKVAGLVISVGRDLHHVPEALREVADEVDFPLIEISYESRFVDIAKNINEHIAQNNMQMLRDVLHIQQQLTQLVLQGGDFKQLADMLAELLQQSISIENERFEAIANKNVAEVDEARRYTEQHGHTDPRLIQALEDHYLPEIRRTLRPVHLPQMPEVGLGMERLLAPIVVHGDIYGYMWIIADDHALSEIDMMAIDSGTTIAALMILHKESVQSAEASLKGSLLAQLIEGNGGRETILTDQSLRYGVDLRSPYIMMLMEVDGKRSLHNRQVYRRINQLATRNEWQVVVGQFDGQVIMLAQGTQDIPQLAAQVLEQVADLQQEIRIGLSATHQGADMVGLAHQQCIEVLDITRRLQSCESVAAFSDLGYLHTLYHAGKDSLHGNPNVPRLRKLLQEKQADLFHTLEAYLESGGNGVQTAETLHIHRSTLNYRLTRITEICQVDLSDPIIRMNLQVALKLMRLFQADN